MKRIETDLRMDPAGVDSASQIINTWLKDIGLGGSDVLRIRLTMEELFLRICDHFDGEVSGTLLLGKRFGTPMIRFRYKSEAFDPTQTQEEAWTDIFLANMGLSPVWRYRFGRNELLQTVPLEKHGFLPGFLALMILAVLLGLSGGMIPAGIRTALSDFLFVPLSEIFTRLLNTFVGLMVFFSVIAGICGIGSAAEFGRIGKNMLVRFIGFSFLGSAAAVLAGSVFMSGGTAAAGGRSVLTDLVKMLLDILPSNPVKPFYDGNSMQIVLMALFIGFVIIGTDEKSGHVRELAVELHMIMTLAVRLLCRMLPLFLFSFLTLYIWENGFQTFLRLWKPVVICIVLCIFFLTAKTILVCYRTKVRLQVLYHKILPTMIVGFMTGSGSAAAGLCSVVNAKKLGIAPVIHNVGNPVGGVLYNSCLSTLLILSACYAAESSGVGGSPVWFLTLWIMGTILSFTIPPVSGGAVACLGLLLIQLGIPSGTAGTASILCLLLNFVCTGFGLGMRHLELILQADRLGMLDREILQSAKTI